MKVFCLLVVVVAVASAYPQGGGGGGHHHLDHGFKINHHHGGGDGHKHEFFKGGHGHIDGHKATSYANIERHDPKDHEVHLKAHPEYHYGFKVADDHTHDIKDKHEEREGYKVKGSYSLLEPDGKTVRVVEYTSDKKEGFNAKVSYRHH